MTDTEELFIKTGEAQVDFSALTPQDASTDQVNEVTDTQVIEDADTSEMSAEEKELLALLDDENTETPETDTETEEGDKDFQVQFEAHFEKTFGMKPDEAVSLVQELVAERQERQVQGQIEELRTLWGGVPDDELYVRLEAVRTVYNSLSKEKQAKFNNPKGAVAIYKQLEMRGKAPKVQRSASKTTATPKFMYTQKQIDSMPLDDYKKQADKIAYAYANGLVQK